MTSPLVSIITVTKNLIKNDRKESFMKCVNSVRMQDYPNIEHLIIDGASKDGTTELFQELGLRYVSEEDSGVYNAFNRGISRASGAYLAFLNSDDFYTKKNAVSSVLEIMQKEKTDFSCAPFDLIDEIGNFLEKRPVRTFLFPFGMPFGHPTMFARRRCLEELGGFDETFKICADFDLINRCFVGGYKPSILKESFVAFRLGGISSTQLLTVEQENVRVVSKTCNLNEKEAKKVYKTKHLPFFTLCSVLKKARNLPERKLLLKRGAKKSIKDFRHKIFTCHLRKGKRCFRFLGITFYNEEKT